MIPTIDQVNIRTRLDLSVILPTEFNAISNEIY